MLSTGVGTLDSDYAFIYQFIDILERLFKMIANLFASFGGGADADADADTDADTEVE